MSPLRWIRTSRFVTDERGISLVIIVVFLPLAVLLCVLAIDVANWFTHHRHLQTQADAAALAAAQDFQFPCTPGGAVDQQIATTAHQYDGTGGGAYNAQIGGATPSTTYSSTQNNVISLVNARNYVNQSEPGDTDLTGSPCTDKAIDVKVTETNTPWFFQLANVNYINARARVSIEQENGSDITRPFAVENPSPNTVHVDLIDESTQQDLGCPDAAHPCGATLTTTDQQTWSNAAAPLAATFDKASTGGFPVGLRVELSSGSSTTCGTAGVQCYDTGSNNGVVFVRSWSGDGTPGLPANNPAPPQAQDASLVPPVGGCADGYFISTTTACSVQLNTAVVFAGGVACKDVAVTLTAGGTGNLPMACPGATPTGSATGNWTSSPTLISSNSGPENFSLDWSQTTGKLPSAAQGGDKNGNCTTNKPCTGSFGAVQRAFSGAFDLGSASGSRSGPIIQASIADAATGTEVPSVRRCSTTTGFVYSTCSRSLIVTIGIQGLQNTETIGGPPVPLRFGTNQGNGTVSCTGNNGNPSLETSIWQACPPPGFVTTTAPATTACSNLPPVTQPQPCAPANPGGGKVNGLEPGIDCLVNGVVDVSTSTCSPSNVCTSPNRWVTGNTISGILSQSTKDPRLIQMIITDAGALENLNGTTPVPVRAFATFYVTGWDPTPSVKGHDPCQAAGISNGLAFGPDDPAAQGELVGHFVKYNDPSATGGGSGNPCTPINVPGDCIAVLTK